MSGRPLNSLAAQANRANGKPCYDSRKRRGLIRARAEYHGSHGKGDLWVRNPILAGPVELPALINNLAA